MTAKVSMPKAKRLLPLAARSAMPRGLMRCALMRSGGFRVYAGFPEPRIWAAIRAEGLARWRTAGRYESAGDKEEWRGGAPFAMRLYTSAGGPALRSFYRSGRALAMVGQAAGAAVAALPDRVGSYSYYARRGDHVGLHRDVVGCDVAVILVLHDDSSPAAAGGALVVYPGRAAEPLSAIRRRRAAGAVALKLTPGHSVVLCGGLVPHAVVPVARGQRRIVAALCYRFLG